MPNTILTARKTSSFATFFITNNLAAFVSLYEAYPPISGAAQVTYHTARFCSGSRLLLQTGRSGFEIQPEADFEIISLPLFVDGRIKKILQMAGWIRKISDQLVKQQPSVVVLEGASWAFYLVLLMRRLRRSLPGTRLMYHGHNVEYFLRRQKSSRMVAWLTFRAERILFRQSDQSFCVSEHDASQVEKLYGIKPSVLPNAVDTSRFNQITNEEVNVVSQKFGIGSQSILFMGLYGYKPNTEAIDFLVREVMPALIKACHLGVAPIFSGSGTRLKILEYMAAGLAVISTRKVAEGNRRRQGTSVSLSKAEMVAFFKRGGSVALY